MRITVKLAGPLRKEVEDLVGGEKQLDLPEGATVSQAIEELGLTGKVRMLMLNGRPLQHDGSMTDGDRLMLLPPSLAYNMYVATNFLAPSVREEIRKKS
ncbi:MAG: MoaD/ThiS family protein [Deltaproteobacteria bacterium]|nr:MoaD/ThiS family protein [Deltaproteobacteria bacterium]